MIWTPFFPLSPPLFLSQQAINQFGRKVRQPLDTASCHLWAVSASLAFAPVS